jgi:hypothetical protein
MTDDQFIADYRSLNADSKAFMRKIMERVAGIGVKTYGPWSAANDTRDMRKERGDELFDAVVYSGMLAVQQERELVDHWNHLVLDDNCQSCNAPAFTLPIPHSTFDLRDDGTDKLAVHEILPAFEDQKTGEWAAKDFDVSDVESEVA